MAHLLIVEDDIVTQRSLIRALSGHDCVGADNGLEALRCMKLGPFDLVISDVDMPIMSGIDLYRCLSRLFPELKIVFRTGSNTQGLWALGVPIISKDKPLVEFLDQIDLYLGVVPGDGPHVQGKTLSQVGRR